MSDSSDIKINMTYGSGFNPQHDESSKDSEYYTHQYADEYFSRYWREGDAEVCKHEWVNVSFNFINEACKHCGTDKPKEK